MIIGIRVEAENIRTGVVKHCNSSYFTMVSKNIDGSNALVPGLILSNLDEVRRFYNCIKMIAVRKEKQKHEEIFDFKSDEALSNLNNYNVQVAISSKTRTRLNPKKTSTLPQSPVVFPKNRASCILCELVKCI